MKRRILFWNEYFLPTIGGAEILSFHLIKALQQRGYEVSVICDNREGEFGEEDCVDGIPVFRFPFRLGMVGDLAKSIAIRKRLTAIATALRTQIVHLHTTGPSLFFFAQNRLFRQIPSLLTVHSIEEPMPEWKLRALQSTCAIVGVSQYILEQIKKRLAPAAAPTHLIHNGLPSPVPGVNWSASCPSNPVVLMVGRVEKEKGFDIGIRAFAKLCQSIPNARLILVGQGRELPFCKSLAAQLKVEAAVDFVGWVKPAQVSAFIAKATLVLIPSRWQEPFGLIALEAAQMQRPVVATRVGGLGEVIEDGVTGRLVPCGDCAAMASAMHSILSQPERTKEMGLCARGNVEKRFDFERMVDQYEALYTQMPNRMESAA